MANSSTDVNGNYVALPCRDILSSSSHTPTSLARQYRPIAGLFRDDDGLPAAAAEDAPRRSLLSGERLITDPFVTTTANLRERIILAEPRLRPAPPPP